MSIAKWFLKKKLSDWIVICFSFLSASLAQADHNLIQQGWWEKWVRRKFSKLGLRVVDFFVEYLTAEVWGGAGVGERKQNCEIVV